MFAAQVEGSRTQPTTAVGLGKKPSRQEHCARCPLTVVKKRNRHVLFSHSSNDIQLKYSANNLNLNTFNDLP